MWLGAGGESKVSSGTNEVEGAVGDAAAGADGGEVGTAVGEVDEDLRPVRLSHLEAQVSDATGHGGDLVT